MEWTPGNLLVLTAEFYLAFWAVLGEDLVEVLNYGFQNGQLSVSQCRGLLSVVFDYAFNESHYSFPESNNNFYKTEISLLYYFFVNILHNCIATLIHAKIYIMFYFCRTKIA